MKYKLIIFMRKILAIVTVLSISIDSLTVFGQNNTIYDSLINDEEFEIVSDADNNLEKNTEIESDLIPTDYEDDENFYNDNLSDEDLETNEKNLLAKIPIVVSELILDIEKEFIKGLDSEKQYEYSTNKTTWISVANGSEEFSIYGVLSSSNINLYVRERGLNGMAPGDSTIFVINGRPSAPTTPVLFYNSATDKILLTNCSSNMEYKKSTDADWISISGSNVLLDTPTSATTYFIRYKGDSALVPASINKSLVTIAQAAAPNVSFSYTTELVIGISTVMEYRIDNGSWQDVKSSSMMLDGDPYLYEKTVEYRVKATATTPASLTKTFSFSKQYGDLVAPTVIYNAEKMTINTTTAMEYRVKDSSLWITCAANMSVSSLLNTKDVVLEIRFKGTVSLAPSKIQELTLNKINEAPELILDIEKEFIKGLDSEKQYEYSTNKTTWISVANGSEEFSIYGVLSSSNINLYVRERGLNGMAPGDSTIFVINGRPSAPTTPVLVYNSATDKILLTNCSSKMEYKKSTDADWISISGSNVLLDTPTSATTYFIRYKGDSALVPASINKSLVTIAQAAAPNVSFSYTTELVTGISTVMEYRMDNGSWQDVKSSSMMLDGDPYLYEKTVEYRVKATATTPASLTKTFSFSKQYGDLVAPTVIYNAEKMTINTTTAMEYRVKDSSLWITCAANMSVSSLLNTKDVVLEIRFKGTVSLAPSKIQELTLNKINEAPKLILDIEKEFIKGLDSEKQYEYSTNKTTWISVANGSEEFSIYGVLSSSNINLYVRERGLNGMAPGDSTIFVINGRPSAPTTPVLVYNSATDKILLTNCSSKMEYKKSTDADWISISGSNVLLDTPTSATTYFIRYKGDSALVPASINKSLVTIAQAAAPNVSFSYTTELVTGISTVMEYRMDNGSWQDVKSSSMMLDGDPYLYEKTVEYRVKATATAPASLTKTFSFSKQYGDLVAPTVIYNAEKMTINTTTAMEYRVKDSSLWITCTANMSVSSLLNTKDVVLEIRFKGTVSLAPSKIQELTLNKINEAPELILDIEKEFIKGLDSEKQYEYSTNKTTWISVANGSEEFSIYGVLSSSNINLYVRERGLNGMAPGDSTIFVINGRPSAPTTPVLVYNSATDKILLTNCSSKMEYKKSTDADWISISGSNVLLDTPTSSTTYFIRYKGDSALVPASINKSLVTIAQAAAPNVSFSYTTELVTGISTVMEYRMDNGSWQDVKSSSMMLDGDPYLYEKTVEYRVKATATAPASLTKTFSFSKQYGDLVAPTVIYNAEKMTINTTTAMEYRVKDSSLWITCTANMSVSSLLNTKDVVLEIRFKGTVSLAPSKIQELTLNKINEAPELILDIEKEFIKGLDSEKQYEYSTNKTTWISVANGSEEFSIYGVLSSSNINLYVRERGLNGMAPGDSTIFVINGRPSAPTTPVLVYNSATDKILLTNCSSKMEYKKSTDADWISISGSNVLLDTPTSATTYFIRYKGDSALVPASINKSLVTIAQAAAPNVSFSYTTELVTGISTVMEYRMDNGSWQDVKSSSMMLDGDPYLYEKTVEYRVKATATAPASLTKTFSFSKQYGDLVAPTVIYNAEKMTINTTTAMEYRVKDSSLWITCTANMSVSSLLNTKDVVLEIRFKGTVSLAPSKIQELTLNKINEAPELILDIEKEFIKGLDSEKQYEYSTNKTTWISVANGSEEFSIYGVLSSSNINLYVRERGLNGMAPGDSTIFVINGRPSAPTTPVLVYNSATDKILLTNCSSKMEYKKSTDADWISISGSNVLLDTPTSATTYFIRYKGDSALVPASINKSLVTIAQAAAPNVSFSYTTELVTGISTVMEYRMDNGSWQDVKSSSMMLDGDPYLYEKTVEYRVKATATAPASLTKTFSFSKQYGDLVAPTVIYNAEKMTINTTTAMEYRVKDSSLWITCAANMSVSSLLNTKDVVLEIRFKGTVSLAPSKIQELTLNNAIKLSPTFDYEIHQDKSTLVGCTSEMEFKTSQNSNWTPFMDTNNLFDIPSSIINYTVRYKDNSRSWTINLIPRAAAPNVSFSYTTELVTGISTVMEYRIDNGSWQDVKSSSMMLDGDPYLYEKTVEYRVKATATTPASLTKTFSFSKQYGDLVAPTVIYNAEKMTINTTTAMEYRVKDSSLWITCAANMSVSSLLNTKDVVLEIRFKGTVSLAPSKIQELTLNKINEAPKLILDIEKEFIKGLDSEKQYEYSTNKTTWISVANGSEEFSIYGVLSSSNINLYVRERGLNGMAPGDSTIFVINGRPSAPTTPVLVYNSATDKILLTNCSSKMEYKKSTDADWISISGSNVLLDTPTSATTYFIRYKGDSALVPASINKSLVTIAQAAAPNVSFSYTTELVTGISTVMEYRMDNGSWQDVKSSSMMLDGDPYLYEKTVEYRVKATATAPASLTKTFSFSKQYGDLVAPTVIYNAEKMTINTTTAMEYRVKDSSLWITCTANMSVSSLLNTKDVVLEIRFKGTVSLAPSKIQELTLNKINEAPELILDIEKEFIKGLDSEKQYEYSTNKTTWISVANGSEEFSIYGVLSSSNINLYVRERGLNGMAPGDSTIFVINGRPSAPTTPVLVYNSATDKILLTNCSSKMEYKKSTDADWISISGSNVLLDTPTSATTYFIRYKGDSALVPASINKSLVTIAQAAAPNVSFSYTTELVTGISTVMEYRMDNGSWQDVKSSSMMLDGDPYLYEKTVEYRVKATATAPASLTKTFSFSKQYGDLVAPTVIYNAEKMTINTTTAMEYRVKDSSLWITCAANMSVSSLLNTKDVVLEIRFKGTVSLAPSKIQELTLNKINEAPELILDIEKEFIKGLDSEKQYEYSTNKTTWISVANGSEEFSIYGVLSSSNINLYVRERGLNGMAPGDSTIFVINGRPSAPTTPVLVYNSATDKILLTNCSSKMEYKKSTDADWISISGSNVLLDTPTSATTYFIRYKGDSALVPASINKSLVTIAQAAAPNVSFSYTTELVIGISTVMEYRMDNGSWQDVKSSSMMLDGDPYLYEKTVEYRVKATATAPASLTKTFSFSKQYGDLVAPTVIYNAEKMTINTTTAMEYRVKDSSLWITCAANMSVSSLLNTKDVVLEIRFKGTVSLAPSKIQELTLNKINEAPELILDIEKEFIKGLDSEKQYEYSTNKTTWISVANGSEEFSIYGVLSSSNINLYVRERGLNGMAPGDSTIFVINGRPSAPTTPVLVYNSATDKILLTNCSSKMEYKKSTDADWISISGSNVLLDTPTSATTYFIRYKGDSALVPASINKSLVTIAQAAAPNVSFSYTTELVTGISTVMEYRMDNGSWQDVKSSSMMLDGDPYLYEKTVEYRVKATATAPASLTKTFSFSKQYGDLVAPTVIYNAEKMTINTTTAMEYRVKDSSLWITCAANMSVSSLLNTKDVVLEIRFKGTVSLAPSKIQELTLNKINEAPKLILDIEKEFIKGLDSEKQYEYSTNKTTWISVANGSEEFSIYGVLSSSNINLYVRERGLNGMAPGDSTIFVINGRPSAPTTPVLVYNSATDKILLTNCSSKMEYKKSTDADWISISGSNVLLDTPTSATTYFIRYKGDSALVPASINKSLVTIAQAAAPNVSFSYTTELVTGISTVMEYRMDNGSWQDVKSSSMMLDGDPYLYEKTVEYRVKATATAPASLTKTFSFSKQYGDLVAPTVIYNAEKMTINTTTAMEYRVKDSSLWITCAANMSVSSLLNTKDVVLEIRFKGTVSLAPSKIQELTLNKINEAPELILDIEKEFIKGLDSEKQYEYSTNKTTWISVANGSEEFSIYGVLSSSNINLYVRERGLNGMAPGDSTIFVINGRPSAPTTPVLVYNSATDKILLTNCSSKMEYKKSTDADWISISGSNVLLDTPTSATTYFIRYKGDSALVPASINKSLVTIAQAAAPNVSFSYTTELVTGISTVMEYRMDNGSWQDVKSSSMMLDGDPYLYEKTVEYRVKATATTPASHIKTIYLYEQYKDSIAPYVTFNYKGITINSTTEMEYRVKGNSSWISCTTNMSVEDDVDKSKDLFLEIRFKGLNTSKPPSKITEVKVQYVYRAILKNSDGTFSLNYDLSPIEIESNSYSVIQTKSLNSGSSVNLNDTITNSKDSNWYILNIEKLDEMYGIIAKGGSIEVYTEIEDRLIKLDRVDDVYKVTDKSYIRIVKSSGSSYSINISPASIVYNYAVSLTPLGIWSTYTGEKSINCRENLTLEVKYYTRSGAPATNVKENIYLQMIDLAWKNPDMAIVTIETKPDPLTGIAKVIFRSPYAMGEYTSSGWGGYGRTYYDYGTLTLKVGSKYIYNFIPVVFYSAT